MTLIGLDPITYELLNLVIWMLCAGSTIIFARYLIIEMRHHLNRKSWKEFFFTGTRATQHDLAIGLLFMVVGEFGLRSWTWYARFGNRVELWTSWMDDFPFGIIPVMCGLFQVLGLLCVSRTISPMDWGAKAWLFMISLISVSVILTMSMS